MNEFTPQVAASALHSMYLPSLKAESRVTKAILEAVPVDKGDYRPDPVSKTAMELVRHIAAADNRFVEMVTTGVFNTTNSLPDDAKTPKDVATWYEQRHAKNLDALAALPEEHLTKVLDFRGILQRPAIMFLMLGLHHTIHHRGQLSSYLRCMGAKVPAIYGESYDSEQAKKAAQA